MDHTYLRGFCEESRRPDLFYRRRAVMYCSRHRKSAVFTDDSVRLLTRSINLDRRTFLYSDARGIHRIHGMC